MSTAVYAIGEWTVTTPGQTRTLLLMAMLKQDQHTAARCMDVLASMGGDVPKQLYVDGHNARRGYAVRLELVDAEPVRYFDRHPAYVRRVVERFNRLQVRAAS